LVTGNSMRAAVVLQLILSGYNNAGTLVNGPTWTGQGELSFDGIDDYVDIANNPSLDMTTELTVTLWMKPLVLATDKSLNG